MAIGDFTQYTLANASITNPTSLQFGSDGRLYVSQQNGIIKAFTVEPAFGGGYAVTETETITLVHDMSNHDDDGTYNPGVQGRQVTGILLVEDAAGEPVLYVTSSDPRIAVGNDSGLDTNSGILSRLKKNADGDWEKVDLVRGLPRSEENHSLNGMQLSPDGKTLFVASGGNTNKGAPGDKFAFLPEYHYAAAVLAIDLEALDALEQTEGLKFYTPAPGAAAQAFLYDLPTLDDPTRPNANGIDDPTSNGYDGIDLNDVFGGNDGLNQAKADMTDRDGDGLPDPIVTIYSPGYRNIYDLLITEDGRFYTWDNGPNTGWGGEPTYADGTVTIDANNDGLPDFYDGDGDGIADTPGNYPSEAESESYGDSLSFVDPDILDGVNPDIYGGHPNPLRAFGAAAGLFGDAGSILPVPPDLASINGYDAFGDPILDPRQAVYRAPVSGAKAKNDDQFDDSLYVINSSSNGLAEYTSSVFPSLTGAILVVSFNGNITALPRQADGTVDTGLVESRGITNKPLDVIAQGDFDPFPGSIWIAGYGPNQIVVLAPDSGSGVTPDPTDRDKDGIDDTIDPFSADPDNGTASILNAGEVWTLDFVEGDPFPNDTGRFFDGTGGYFNGFDIGFSGVMTTGAALPDFLYGNENIIAGGAPNQFQIKDLNLSSGTPATDSQLYGFQFGLSAAPETGAFVYSSLMDNFFDEIAGISAGRDIAQGIFVGTGDQSDYVSLVYARRDGVAGIEVTVEASSLFGSGTPQTTFYEVPELLDIANEDTVELRLTVDITSGTLTPGWTVTTGNKTGIVTEVESAVPVVPIVLGEGDPAQFQGPDPLLVALRGQATLPALEEERAVGVAVGILASADAPEAGTTPPILPVEWDLLRLEGIADPSYVDAAAPQVRITSFDPGDAADGPFEVELVITDDTALDAASLAASDLIVAIPPDALGDPVDPVIADFTLELSQDNRLAVARYQILPSTGFWSDGVYEFSVAAGAVTDAFGNGNAAVVHTHPHTVGGPNALPVVASPVDPQTAIEDEPFAFVLPADTFSDPDGDGLLLNVISKPSWVEFDPVLRIFSGTPLNDDVGTTEVVVSAADAEGSVETSFSLTVENVNDPPRVAAGIADKTAAAGSGFFFTLPAGAFEDPDGDTLGFAASGLPAWLSFDPANGSFSGTPGIEDIGAATVTVEASDGEFSVSDSFTVTVLEPIVPGTVITAINAGGPARTAGGIDWLIDKKNNPYPGLTVLANNSSYITTTPISDAGDFEEIYRSSRYSTDSFFYDIDVVAAGGLAGGEYRVTLLFAETLDAVTAPGQRVFDVMIEGSFAEENGVVVGDDFDILAAAGSPLTATQIVSVVDLADFDSVIDIDLITQGIQNPMIAGILVEALGPGDGGDENAAPFVDAGISDQVAAALAPFTFAIPDDAFFDPDGDALSYAVPTALPAWLGFDAASGTFSGTPGTADTGDVSVTVEASDGEFAASTSFTIAVGAENAPPVVEAGIADQTALEDAAFSFAVPADAFSDPEGDALTLALVSGPGWLTFDAASATLSGTPLQADVGAATVGIAASDGVSSVETSFTLTVANVNDAPVVLTGMADRQVTPDEALSFSIPSDAFFDEDGDALSYTASGLPSWLAFDPSTAQFAGTPGAGDIGTATVTVEASDGEFSASDSFDVTVSDAPAAGTVVAAINAGGPARTVDGIDWAIDKKNNPYPGLTLTANNRGVITGEPVAESGALLEIYQSYRLSTGSFGYDIDVPAAGGLYRVTMLFAELDDFTASPGQRVFDVLVEGAFAEAGGVAVGDGFDILEQAGGQNIATGIVTTVELAPGDAVLDIDLVDLDIGDPIISGILVEALDGIAVADGIADQLVAPGAAYAFAIPDAAFLDFSGDTLSYTVTSTLPGWLDFDGTSFTGTPAAADLGTYQISVTASDGQYEATETFAIAVAEPLGSARLEIHTGSLNEEISSFVANSFQLFNTGTDRIVSVTIDVSGALLSVTGSWVVFDPIGTGGDVVAKGLDVNTEGGTGIVLPGSTLDPFTVPLDGGYAELRLDFDTGASGGFETGEMLGFSIDLDPTGIGGATLDPASGDDPGGISGFEMIGSRVTVTYESGNVQTGWVFADLADPQGPGAIATVRSGAQVQSPVLSVNGETGAVGGMADTPSITISGPANAAVALVWATGRTDPDVPPVSPFFANALTANEQRTVVLDATGQATITDITVGPAAPVFVSAAVLDMDGRPVSVSAPLVLSADDVEDFGAASFAAYGGEAVPASVEVSADGNGVELVGEGSASVAIDPYLITADTVLAFQFRTDAAGALHGIGVDDDDDRTNGLSALGDAPIFQVAGGGGDPLIGALSASDTFEGWSFFETSLAEFAGMTADRLVFVNDDAGDGVASAFRDVWLYEAGVA